MNRKPTAATTLARPRRESADPLAGFSVGRGVDPAGSVAGQRRKTSFLELPPFSILGE